MITIYTWGNQVRKNPPLDCQENFSVTGISSYKPKGIDLEKVDGRDPKLQETLQKQPKFHLYFQTIIHKIIQEKLTKIAINCRKGWHRSVGTAELIARELRQRNYNVNVIHLELN
jgi:RNase adaptor protein for sRNA GlmZ degradation